MGLLGIEAAIKSYSLFLRAVTNGAISSEYCLVSCNSPSVTEGVKRWIRKNEFCIFSILPISIGFFSLVGLLMGSMGGDGNDETGG